VGEPLAWHASDTRITVYFRHQPVATPARQHHPGITTEPAHMPKRHQWTPGRLKHWARDIGPEVLRRVDRQLTAKTHPEQAYRRCLGLLNLCREYPAQRLNAACRIANTQGLDRLKQVKSILQSNRDRLPDQATVQTRLAQDHENIRGPRNFH
jgi:hypothetical protein